MPDSKYKLEYDVCGIRCDCQQISYLANKAGNLLNDIQKLRGINHVLKCKRMRIRLSCCCLTEDEVDK